MSQDYTITKVKAAGQKPNPHGGTLYKFYVAVADEVYDPDDNTGIYWQRKSPDLTPGEVVYGDIEQGDYGPRFRTAQREDGAPAPSQGTPGVAVRDERGRRIERQHSQEMAIRLIALSHQPLECSTAGEFTTYATEELLHVIDWFQNDLDADVGGGNQAREPAPPVDVSAGVVAAGNERPDGSDAALKGADSVEPAPPALKARTTHLMNQAGLAKPTRQAVIMFRCGTLSDPPKDKLMALVKDLEDGATHDALVAEIWDAHRAGNPLGTRAKDMLPVETPNAEPPPEEAKDGDDIPF